MTDPTIPLNTPAAPTATAPIPRDLIPPFDQCAFLLDIDGTLLDMALKPRDVVVPPGLKETLTELLARTGGALAMVSGRSMEDIDFIFGPEFPAVGGHGAEMRISQTSAAIANQAPPMDINLKRRFAKLADMSDGILLEDKGYSLALHFRLAPDFEEAIYDGVSAIRSDLPNAPIEVLPGKFVCEIKHSGVTKATGVAALMEYEPFAGRRPIFLGDDVTDESVFAIMPDMKGLAFSVGRRAQGVDGHFDEPANVRQWLKSLLDPI